MGLLEKIARVTEENPTLCRLAKRYQETEKKPYDAPFTNPTVSAAPRKA